MKKRNKKFRRLSLYEMNTIARMRKRGYSIRKIAKEINRSTKSVYLVIKEYDGTKLSDWYATNYELSKQRLKQRHKNKPWGCIRSTEVRRYIEKRLQNGDSPEVIASTMHEDLPGQEVSFKTIYNFTKRTRGLKKYLFEKGKKRRQRVVRARNFGKAAPKKINISERPQEANERTEIGHFECDLIVSSKKGTGGILNLVDRKTRKSFCRKVTNLKSETVLASLLGILLSLPKEVIRSITFDNGSEFSYTAMVKLKKYFPGLLIFYADAYCPWQKGTVENNNRLYRAIYPKGTDFGSIEPQFIYNANFRVNSKRKKCLNFITPNQAFKAELKTLLGNQMALVA